MTSPQDHPAQAPQSFSYGRFIVESKMTGLSAMIACHCEPTFYNAETPFLRLEIPPKMMAFKGTAPMAIFEQAIRNFLGQNVELETIEGPAVGSPAAVSSAKKLTVMKGAYGLIMEDELVNSLLKEFGGKILVETVQPVNTNKKLTP